ncbi:hypothetical protein [Shimazuella alba]|uniref:Uncharacterized protein n=1 Tax=Shimazuella alba TaxID=2690964 RepID=A0A6I4VRL1_9BACL|nr:hypothetical protein [Shimazuella alba]MXQ52420.1 hypothetical protein [Shimazuella alba]
MKTVTILCEANPETDKEHFIQLYKEVFLPESIKINGVVKIQYSEITPVESDMFQYTMGKDIFFSITVYFPSSEAIEAMISDERTGELLPVFTSLGVSTHWFVGVEDSVTRYHF